MNKKEWRKRNRILNIYKFFRRGKERAITREQFYAKYRRIMPKLPDREFRRIYSQLPICTCDKGGYWPIRPGELEEFRIYMKKKAVPHFTRFNMVRDSHPELAGNVRQLDLFRGQNGE